MLRKRLRRSFARTAVIFSLIAAFLAAGGLVYATTFHTEWTYYSDPSFTEVVGFRMQTCSGGTYKYGQVTQYKEVFQEACN